MSKHIMPQIQFPITVHVSDLQGGTVHTECYHIIDADHMTSWVKNESRTYMRNRHIAESVQFLWNLASVKGTATFHGIATYRFN